VPTLLHGDQTIHYKIIRSNRIKTSEILVDAHQVIVRSPQDKPLAEIKAIIKKKADWIANKQKEYRHQNSEISKPSFDNGSTLPYFGKNYKLQILTGSKTMKFRLIGKEFIVTLMTDTAGKRQVQKLYEGWLMEKAEETFTAKVKYYAEKVGVSPKRIVIKNLRRRWGSATVNNTLNLNLNLLKAPEDVIDYVILHELCHLKERNHSHRFWSLLGSIMPSYKQKSEWLSANVFGLVE
jgi:predicted metal-dependent hydrolase